MKIVVRTLRTHEFVHKHWGWTTSLDDARDFQTSADADQYVSEGKLTGVEIVLKPGGGNTERIFKRFEY